ncbi:MAG: hypothetical protein ACXWJD_04035 [Burkholderiaceae bacterium]
MAGSAGTGGSADNSQRSTTNNTTQSLSTDKRIVADGNSSVYSLDNSTVTMGDYGAISMAGDLANHAVSVAGANADHVVAAGVQLGQTAMDMLAHSDNLAQSLLNSNASLAEQSLAQNQAALQVVQSLAMKPLSINDPAHALVIAGIVIVGVVAFTALKGKL